MVCKSVVVKSANNWMFDNVETRDIDGVEVKVIYSSFCGTDRDVISGNLIYYKNNTAHYPIITGHEWCGIYNDQPVVGVCILGCGNCKKCVQDKQIHCDSRREVGVVNKNGAHSEYIFMPVNCLVGIPELLPKYALVEPLAVCIHALEKLNIKSTDRILISGYGCIGKLCGLFLNLHGCSYEVYDPQYTSNIEFYDFDIILECSGNGNSLDRYINIKGSSIVVFGFEYNPINPSVLSANEISILGTLGSTISDFIKAAEIMKYIDPDFFEVIPLDKFSDGILRSYSGKKTVFNHPGD